MQHFTPHREDDKLNLITRSSGFNAVVYEYVRMEQMHHSFGLPSHRTYLILDPWMKGLPFAVGGILIPLDRLQAFTKYLFYWAASIPYERRFWLNDSKPPPLPKDEPEEPPNVYLSEKEARIVVNLLRSGRDDLLKGGKSRAKQARNILHKLLTIAPDE